MSNTPQPDKEANELLIETLKPLDELVLRPVKKQWEVVVQQQNDTKYFIEVYNLDVTPKQVVAIKDCVSELMRVVTEARGDLNEYPPRELLNLISRARQLLGGDK